MDGPTYGASPVSSSSLYPFSLEFFLATCSKNVFAGLPRFRRTFLSATNTRGRLPLLLPPHLFARGKRSVMYRFSVPSNAVLHDLDSNRAAPQKENSFAQYLKGGRTLLLDRLASFASCQMLLALKMPGIFRDLVF